MITSKVNIEVNKNGVRFNSDDYNYYGGKNVQSGLLDSTELGELLYKVEKLIWDNKEVLFKATKAKWDYDLKDVKVTKFQMEILSRLNFESKTLSQIAKDNNIDNVIFAIETLWGLGLLEKDFDNKTNFTYKISEIGNRFLEIKEGTTT